MLPEGVYHWTARHPEWEGPVSAYAIDDGARLILIDPLAVPDDVRELFGSREVLTVLTSTWHERDAASSAFPCGPRRLIAPRTSSSPRPAMRSATRCSGWRPIPAVKASSTSYSGTSGFAQ